MAFGAGIGRCIRNLVPRVAAAEPTWRVTLLGDRSLLGSAAWAEHGNVEAVECQAPVYSLHEQWTLWRRTPRDIDVFWAPHYNIPVLVERPLVVTVHDLAHLRRPEFSSGIVRRMYARTMFQQVRKRAAEILCVSEFSRGEFVSLVGEARRPPTVAHNGLEAAWFDDARVARPIAERYFLFVGSARPHKNLGGLLRALESVRDTAVHLIVVSDSVATRTQDRAVDQVLSRLGGRVIQRSGINDHELRTLMRHAEALVMPSLYEGFGFPPLEAMAGGTPAIVARAGSLPEICGSAALYVDPNDPASIAAQLREVLNNPRLRDSLAGPGRAQAHRYQWDESAAALRAALKRAASNA